MRRSLIGITLLGLLVAAALLCQTPVIGPLPGMVAKVDLAGQSANIGLTTMYVVPAASGGTYRLSCYPVVTQAATTSSTLPYCVAGWTDSDTAVANGLVITSGSATANTVGTTGLQTYGYGSITFQAKAGSNIQYQFGSYASVGATPMLYAAHVKLEYLGQ